MGAGRVGGALGAAALIATVAATHAPLPRAGAVVVAALVVAAGLWGLGRLVAAAAGTTAPVSVTIAWGVAAYLSLGGWFAAAGRFDAATQRGVIVIGVAIAAAWVVARPPRQLAPAWRQPAWLLGITVVAVVVGVHLLGAAGTWDGRFSDGEAYLLGPVGRLASAGDLGDAVSLPRRNGLGGSVVLATLTATFREWRMLHVIDQGLALALTLGLVLGGGRRRASFLTGCVLVALASALPATAIDAGPRWTTVALLLTLIQMWPVRGATPRAWLPALLVAGALATLQHGGLGVMAVVMVCGLRSTQRPWMMALGGAAMVAAMLGGYLIAGRATLATTVTLLGGRLPLRLAPWLAAAGLAAAVGVVTPGAPARRGPLIAVAVGAALAGALASAPSLAWPNVMPYGIALIFSMVARLLDDDAVDSPARAIAVAMVTLTLATVRFPVGRPPLSWEDRLGRLIDGARALDTARPGAGSITAVDYQRALADLPAGARVGLWLDRGDLVDHRGRRFIDLRTAAAAACVEQVPVRATWFRPRLASCRAFARTLETTRLDLLLVDPAALPRRYAWLAWPMCRVYSPDDCVDPLSRLVGAKALAGPGPLLVISLRGDAAGPPGH
ncbi:MAG: hypothetical protein R3B06_09100 [Kofleriaceae bacterium]